MDASEVQSRRKQREDAAQTEANKLSMASIEREALLLREGVALIGKRLTAMREWLDQAITNDATVLAMDHLANGLDSAFSAHAAVRGSQVQLATLQSRLAFLWDALKHERAQVNEIMQRDSPIKFYHKRVARSAGRLINCCTCLVRVNLLSGGDAGCSGRAAASRGN